MKNQSKIAAFLAAGFMFGTAAVSLAQTTTGGKKVKTPTQSTGSGKDTGMNIESGMSGNGGGGIGTVGAGAGTVGAKPSGSSKKKNGSRHTKKKTSSSASAPSSNGSAATATQ